MSYTVLARRYRSRDFDEIVGQDPIARTLRNAIDGGRTAHAYLFCGTRGVGKTSMARIFARALNVSDDLEEAPAIAEAILRGDDLDVIEIDGASNRGIQEARDLIAGAGLSPARCRYKVYIIDEVHMLTREAFNALLKTMEEPPAHVKFILCTTEPQKVPATIQSRCQRFDFRPLPTSLIAEQLRHVLRQEGVEADDDLVARVARLGHGSMRDALSLLDRLLAAGEGRLTLELLERMVGVPDHSVVVALIDAVADGEAELALERSGRLLGTGASVAQVLELLTEHLHTLLVVAVCGEGTDLLELSAEARQVAQRQAARFDAAGLVHMIALCDSVARNARGSSTARALLDALVVRLCLCEHVADIPALLEGAAAGRGDTVAATADPAPRLRKKKEQPLSGPEGRPPPDPAAGPPDAITEAKPASPPPSEAGLWDAVVRFAQRSHSDMARIDHLRFESFDGRTLRLSVPEAGSRLARFLSAQAPRIGELVERATGREVRVEIEVPTTSRTVADLPEQVLTQVRDLPAVAQVLELFDATIIDVQDDSPDTDAADRETEREPNV